MKWQCDRTRELWRLYGRMLLEIDPVVFDAVTASLERLIVRQAEQRDSQQEISLANFT